MFQYKTAKTYLDRREAVDFAAKNQADAKAVQFLKSALQDNYYGLRNYTLGKLDMRKDAVRSAVESKIYAIAQKDPKSTVRAKAISLLPNYVNTQYKTLYAKAVNDSSYSVSGEALDALLSVDSVAGFKEAQRLSKSSPKGKLGEVITESLIKYGDENSFDVVVKIFADMPVAQSKFEMLQPFSNFLAKVQNTEKFKKGIDLIVEFREAIPGSVRGQTDPFINDMILKGLANKKKAQGIQEHVDYINSKLGDKKGF